MSFDEKTIIDHIKGIGKGLDISVIMNPYIDELETETKQEKNKLKNIIKNPIIMDMAKNGASAEEINNYIKAKI